MNDQLFDHQYVKIDKAWPKVGGAGGEGSMQVTYNGKNLNQGIRHWWLLTTPLKLWHDCQALDSDVTY